MEMPDNLNDSPITERRWYGHTNDTYESMQIRSTLLRLVSNPEKFVDETFAQITNHGEIFEPKWIEKLKDKVQQVYTEADVADLYRIPCLNSMTEEKMKKFSGHVVRYRCMVQQSFDARVYLTRTMIKNNATGEVEHLCLAFKDTTNLEAPEGFSFMNMEENLHYDSLDLLHCISVPGENKWVLEVDNAYKQTIGPSADLMEEEDLNGMESNGLAGVRIPTDAMKLSCIFPLNSMYNDPICKAVTAQIYKISELRVNDVVDLYGVLSFDQAENEVSANPLQEALENYNVESDSQPEPGPRLHVLGYSRACSFEMPTISFTLAELDHLTLIDDWRSPARNALINLLEDMCMGDQVLSQYVALHLISSVNARIGGNGGVPLGSLPIAILDLPKDHCQFINMCIQALVTKSVYVNNLFDSLLTDTYNPKKNLSNSIFKSGMLQLSQGTHLLLEEKGTAEQQRNMRTSPKAMENLVALQKLIEWQTVDYDFTYHRGEFLHDIPILILSEGSSMFNCAIQVPFLSEESEHDRHQKLVEFEAEIKPRILKTLGNQSEMAKIRDYILFAKKSIKFEITDSAEQFISTEYSLARTTKCPSDMDSEDFSRTLTLARYFLQFFGETELTERVYNTVRTMETQRKLRLIKCRMST